RSDKCRSYSHEYLRQFDFASCVAANYFVLQSRRRSLSGTISGESFHTVRRLGLVEQLKIRKAACETETESKRKRRGRGRLSSSVGPGIVGLQIGSSREPGSERQRGVQCGGTPRCRLVPPCQPFLFVSGRPSRGPS